MLDFCEDCESLEALIAMVQMNCFTPEGKGLLDSHGIRVNAEALRALKIKNKVEIIEEIGNHVLAEWKNPKGE